MDVVLVVFIKSVFVGLEEGGESFETFLVEVGNEFITFRLLAFPCEVAPVDEADVVLHAYVGVEEGTPCEAPLPSNGVFYFTPPLWIWLTIRQNHLCFATAIDRG